MTTPINHVAAVAAAIRAVEEAWDSGAIELGGGEFRNRVMRSVEMFCAARRAARDAGYVEVMLDPETVRLILESQTSPDGRWAKALVLVCVACAIDACARLGPLLKE